MSDAWRVIKDAVKEEVSEKHRDAKAAARHASRERDSEPSRRFEYKAVYVAEWKQKGWATGQRELLESQLNELGAKGWEVVAVAEERSS